MNCIIKSWRCSECFEEHFIVQPKKRHFKMGKICRGEWEEWNWYRGKKPLGGKT